ncbi:coadhesin-like [Dreissena polymorpha]|nr:coadhesin-like [Dreissena polymorpha]XP_052254087.1 coadhesin-like [Dreissena polymorpha]
MCPINGGYTSWSSWGTCSVTCASGIWTRSRSCSNPAPQHKGADCTSLGAATETSSCNTGIMCPINGGYTSWSAWGMCSVTCEDGTKIRSRSCTNPAPQHNGANCNSLGAASETSSCNAGIMCPIDGGYTSWTMWSACSVTCEKGSMSRSRTCSNPTPLHNGANCDKFGANNEEEACDAGIMCPIDGGYADWSGWSKCSAECGSGFINRTRTCTNPEPQYDGASCAVIGSPDDSEVCDTGVPCKVDGTWGKWQAWSVCSKTCGGGKSQRVRYCDNPAPKGGGAPCFGSAMETKTCSSEKCPIDPNANAYSVQKCPNGFFACKTGSITCIEDLFVCDCAEDCADGSDESKTWAQCPTTCKSNAKALKATIGTLAVMMAIINLLHI